MGQHGSVKKQNMSHHHDLHKQKQHTASHTVPSPHEEFKDADHSNHQKYPVAHRQHHGAHERHIDEHTPAPDTKHGHEYKGGQGGNHSHPRNWDQHSHPAQSHLDKVHAEKE